MKTMSDCPVCQATDCLEVSTKTEKIPYFGEVMETAIHCQKCGYRHSDVICLDRKEPVKYTLTIDGSNFSSRVVK